MKPSFYVYRVQTPAYLESSFSEQESGMIAELGGQLVAKPKERESINAPQIMISSSQTNLANFNPALFDLIIHPNSGYDNFNTPCLKRWPIPIILGNRLRAQSVAEYILCCLIHFHGAMPWTARWDKDRLWDHQLLGSKKILVFGSGEIGRKVESMIRALGAECEVIDPYGGRSLALANNDIEVIILCCSLNEGNKGMVNKPWLQTFPNLQCLINPARGELMDQEFIQRDILEFNQITFYLDVFPDEPFEIEKFSTHSNVHLSSHVAGVHQNLGAQMINFERDVILDFLALDRPTFQQKYYPSMLASKWMKGMLI